MKGRLQADQQAIGRHLTQCNTTIATSEKTSRLLRLEKTLIYYMASPLKFRDACIMTNKI